MIQNEPIRRRKLAHEVLDRLLARLRAGEFPVGSTLPSERELMENFSVGRPAIREALQAMERMGFIAIVHGEGAKVLPVTATTVISQISESAMHMLANSDDLLAHLRDAREFFEVNMVRTVVDKVTDEDLKILAAALEENRASMNDQEQFQKTDMAFHKAIAQVSGNPIFPAVSQAMLEWLGKSYADLVWNPGREELIYSEHQAIFERIAARDAEGAAKAMADHLARANERFLKA